MPLKNLASREPRFGQLLLLSLVFGAFVSSAHSSAFAADFDLTAARDWARNHIGAGLWTSGSPEVGGYDPEFICVNFPSCTWHAGGVPFDYSGSYHFYATLDPISAHPRELQSYSHSWFSIPYFESYFTHDYPNDGAGLDYRRVGAWRCSVCPDEDSRFQGGYITMYCSDDGGQNDSDPWHSGVIHGQHQQSHYDSDWWGSCKIDRSPPDEIHYKNAINLEEREDPAYRATIWVEVWKLVDTTP